PFIIGAGCWVLQLHAVNALCRPRPNLHGRNTYEVISALPLLSGLCVATLFCFFNGEVIAQVKRKWRTTFLSNRPRANSYTATQV
ncbi:hypothetical protein DOY81_011872, partial [Sarcophaga bullata]